MDSNHNNNGGNEADKAITSVLASEREAHEGVERCREDARLRLKSAQMRSARIRQQADHRITQLHRLCLEKSQRELGGIRQSHHQALLERIARIQPDDGILEQAAQRLALELIMGQVSDDES